jgi:hypothetical protein
MVRVMRGRMGEPWIRILRDLVIDANGCPTDRKGLALLRPERLPVGSELGIFGLFVGLAATMQFLQDSSSQLHPFGVAGQQLVGHVVLNPQLLPERFLPRLKEGHETVNIQSPRPRTKCEGKESHAPQQ